MRLWPIAAVVVVGVVAIGVVLTAGPDPDAVPTADQVAGRMMSPFCPGLTLDECPSDQANRLRGEVEALVATGATNREVDEWIVDNFGVVALASPDSSVAWIAPPLLAVAGLATVLLVLRRKPRAEEPSAAELSPQDEDLFDRDFGNFRKGSE